MNTMACLFQCEPQCSDWVQIASFPVIFFLPIFTQLSTKMINTVEKRPKLKTFLQCLW